MGSRMEDASSLASEYGQIEEKLISIRTLSALALRAMFVFARPHVLHAQQSARAISEGYMSRERANIAWLDDHWAVRFEMDPSVETEECAGYSFRYVYVRKDKLVERYISER
jgi:hypothetical protein